MSATTPYYQTPSRRALGDLTPRAINSPSTQTRNAESSEAIQARSPLKKVTSHIPSAFADKENLRAADASPQGKKRGIDEVEEVESAGNAKMLARGRDETLWESGMRLTTAAMQRHTENNPVGLVDPGSPTERNTPSPEPEAIQQASQRSNQSFSDLLNYELCASQKSDHHPAEAAPTSAPTSAPTEPKKSRAELLRTRLKFGLYKVNTNQATKRGKDIISSFEATTSHSDDSFGSPRIPNITISSPRREPTFIKANLDPFLPIGRLGAHPPVLFAPPKDSTHISSRPVELSHVSPHQLVSPVKQRPRLGEHDEADIEQGAAAAHWRLQRLKDQSYRAADRSNSNSAGQGNAAVGLMELMAGRR